VAHCISSLFFHGCAALRSLHSFPTRRSSDLLYLRVHAGKGEVRAVVLARSCAVEQLVVLGDKRLPSVSIFPQPVAEGVLDDLLRSEEHTSELQSRFDLVCRLLLEKKKKSNQY